MKIELEFSEDRQKREIVITVLAKKVGCREEWAGRKIIGYHEIMAQGDDLEDFLDRVRASCGRSAVYALAKL